MEFSYYAVIPSPVLYDEHLPPRAKLLYGVLTTLTKRDGYCWATDKFFAELFGVSVRTASSLLSALKERGYIRVEVGSGERGTERHIYAGAFFVAQKDAQGGMEENCVTPGGSRKKLPEGSRKKLPDPIGDNNNFINSPPTSPPGGERVARGPKKAPDWKPERFERFWKYYPIGKGKQAAIRAWDKLKPDDALLAVIGQALQKQKASSDWQRGIGIPYAATYLNQRRWEDEDRFAPAPSADGDYLPDVEVSRTWT